jgi:hypothetical protein
MGFLNRVRPLTEMNGANSHFHPSCFRVAAAPLNQVYARRAGMLSISQQR